MWFSRYLLEFILLQSITELEFLQPYLEFYIIVLNSSYQSNLVNENMELLLITFKVLLLCSENVKCLPTQVFKSIFFSLIFHLWVFYIAFYQHCVNRTFWGFMIIVFFCYSHYFGIIGSFISYEVKKCTIFYLNNWYVKK